MSQDLDYWYLVMFDISTVIRHLTTINNNIANDLLINKNFEPIHKKDLTDCLKKISESLLIIGNYNQ